MSKKKKKIRSGWFVVLAVALFVVAISSLPGRGAEVSRDTWTEGEWPLTVEKGRLDCYDSKGQPSAVFIDEESRTWALNGVARMHGYGEEIEPIWKARPLTGGRVNLGGLTAKALELCGGD